MPRRTKMSRRHLVGFGPASDESSTLVDATLQDGVAPFGVIAHNDLIKIVIPTPANRSRFRTIDFSFLLTKPLFARPMANAVFACFGHSHRAVSDAAEKLESFYKFLTSESDIHLLVDITTELIQRYIQQLNEKPSDTTGTLLAETSRKAALKPLRKVFRWLATSSETTSLVRSDLYIRRNPWPNAHLRSEARTTLSYPEIKAVVIASIKEVVEIVSRVRARATQVQRGRSRLLRSHELKENPDYNDLEIVLARVAEMPEGFPRSLPQIFAFDKNLGQAVQYKHGYMNIARYFLPFPRDITPLAIILFLHTGYNADTLLGLVERNISPNWLLPDMIDVSDRVILSAEKGRAGTRRSQVRTFVADDSIIGSVAWLLRAANDITSLIRPFTHPAFSERLLIFKPKIGTDVLGFASESGPSGDQNWKYSLTTFCKDNGLPHFSASQLRCSHADLVSILTDGDVKAQQEALGHASADITIRHYVSPRAKEAQREEIAHQQNIMLRWVSTDGRRDVRGSRERSLTAATPGFVCLDPYCSPIPGQTIGRLCDAFLRCFDCPLGAVDRNDPYSLALLLELDRKFVIARRNIHPLRYQEYYFPFEQKLKSRIQEFSAEVVSIAQTIRVKPMIDFE